MFTSVFQSGAPGIVTFKGDSEGEGGGGTPAAPYALSFDGVDARVRWGSVNNPPDDFRIPSTGNWTIAAWYRPNNPAHSGWLFAVRDATAVEGFGLGINGQRQVRAFINGASAVNRTTVPNFQLTTQGRMHLLMATWNGGTGTLSIYVDGQPRVVATGQNPGTINFGLCTADMGWINENQAANGTLNGIVGELGVWDSDESNNAVAIHNNGSASFATLTNAPNILHFRFDQNDDPTTQINDKSGRDNHGTPTNMVAGDLVQSPVAVGWQ